MDEISYKNPNQNKSHPNTTYKIHTLKDVYDKLHSNLNNIKAEIRCNNDLKADAKDNLIEQMNTIRHLLIDIECDWTY